MSRPQVDFDRLSAGDRWRTGDWLSLSYSPPTPAGASEPPGGIATEATTLQEAAAHAEKLAKVPGAWWRRQSPLEVLEPLGPRQEVVWELMYPQGHPRTGMVGYAVRWHRGTP